MKLTGINPDPANRAELDAQIRVAIKHFLDTDQVSVDEVVFLLTRMLPELADPYVIAGHLFAAIRLADERGTKPLLSPEHPYNPLAAHPK